MEIVLINLDRAKERMAFQCQQFDRLGLRFSRLSADCPSHHDNFVKYQQSWQRPLSYSEVCVFFNHKKIWERIIQESTPMLILEDDAYLADNTPELLKKIEGLTNIDYLNIEARGNKQKKLIAKNADYYLDQTALFRLYQGRSGAGGYVLWPEGAKKLLALVAQGKIGIVDKFINSSYLLNAYQLEPAILIQMDMCENYGLSVPLKTHSYIDSKIRNSSDVFKNIKYKLRRLKGELKIAINFLRHLYYAEKRALRISDKFRF
ncbi:glycosyltransferase family 25 protein [Paraglaciecola sp.]|nr:glycosyltransferase family 25 protein [Paraglaciecola sp.]MDB4281569.1 glycosyltransferase family 25 protein [Paraglaciecola sp.]MDB4327023.1 glycosyltransferase family 25 protein [bacterium]